MRLIIHDGDRGTHMTARLVNTQTAADYLGLRPVTLEAWRTRGGGPEYVRLGRAIRYDMAALDRFIEANSERSTSERNAA